MRRLGMVLLALLFLCGDGAFHKARTGPSSPSSPSSTTTSTSSGPMPPMMVVQTSAAIVHGLPNNVSIQTDYLGFTMSYSTIELINHRREATGGSAQVQFRYPIDGVLPNRISPYVSVGGGYSAGWGHANYSIFKAVGVGVSYTLTDLSLVGVSVTFANGYHTPLFKKPSITYGLSFSMRF